jgi:hypothetical protein
MTTSRSNKHISSEYAAFENVLRRVLKVSKADLDETIKAAKMDRKRRREAKKASSSRASGE